MPYFQSKGINLLFIHIPKTGGTSVENYLSKKYEIPLNIKSLFGIIPYEVKSPLMLQAISFQHIIYKVIVKYQKLFGIKSLPNFKVVTIVRNPYERIISDLFFFKIINTSFTPEKVYLCILNYLFGPKNYDNHQLPQHVFIENKYGKIPCHVFIMHTETLTEDMRKFGFEDFDTNANVNPYRKHIKSYYDYLNKKSIFVINKFYRKDFITFGYRML
jgi:hypothetical protein